MFDLTGRRALVTGASGGIGAAIAQALHRQGAIVGIVNYDVRIKNPALYAKFSDIERDIERLRRALARAAR